MLTFLISAAAIAVLFAVVMFFELRYGREPLTAAILVPPYFRRRATIEGYDQPELIEVIFQKTKAFKSQSSMPEIFGAATVLDFGGGCGIHYKQANLPTVRWAVVETAAMVERAKELATDQLKFFTDIAEAQRWLGDVDVVYSNGALQYSDDPVVKLKQLCAVGANRMLWYRMMLSAGVTEREVQSSRLSDNGPGTMRVVDKTVRYDLTKIPESDFIAAHASYELAERGQDWFRFTKPE